jgi:hypothetical protein
MTQPLDHPQHPVVLENEAFFEKAERGVRDLFERARTKNELHFAFSLNPEFRGEQDAGWSTAADANVAFNEYLAFIEQGEPTSLKARVALAFYCHLAEASGYYEIPKNMLRVVGGESYNLWPFQNLVQKHKQTGAVIAPNANKVLQDLAGHAATLGLSELAEVFRDAFDPDIRTGYAHADYIIWKDGIRLRKRNGGFPRKVSWAEFDARFSRGINVFHLLRVMVEEYVTSYHPAKTIRARMADNEPELVWTIHFDPEKKSFGISGGLG